MLKNLVLVMVSVVFFGLSAGAQSCPIPAGDDTLTLSGIMRNFGRALMASDKAAQKGTMDPADVNDALLSDAIKGIQMAEACTQAAIEDETGALWPSHAKELSGEELTNYLETFRMYLQAFAQTLVDYRAEFEAQAALPAGERSYGKVEELRQAVRAAAKDAHGDL